MLRADHRRRHRCRPACFLYRRARSESLCNRKLGDGLLIPAPPYYTSLVAREIGAFHSRNGSSHLRLLSLRLLIGRKATTRNHGGLNCHSKIFPFPPFAPPASATHHHCH